jgi:hypothetical protein
MTIILDTCVCVLVHPFLAKSNQITCTYIFHVVLRMCLLFRNYIVGDLGSNEENVHCSMLWLCHILKY